MSVARRAEREGRSLSRDVFRLGDFSERLRCPVQVRAFAIVGPVAHDQFEIQRGQKFEQALDGAAVR